MSLRVGAALAVTYVVVVALTAALVPRHVRPLFDGFTPPAPYQYVEPPAELAHANKPPDSVTVDVSLTADPNVQLRSAATKDGQVLVNFGETALVGAPGDMTATISLTPFAPSSLGDLPKGVVANGNAYRVQITHRPSGTPQTDLRGLAYLLLKAPEQPVGLFHSLDGERWKSVKGAVTVTGARLVRAEFEQAGWFVAYQLSDASVTSDRATPPLYVLAVGLAALGALAFSALRMTKRRESEAKERARAKKPKTRSKRRR